MAVKDSPVFSIILPTHNRCQLLARAIDSVLKQSFSDFELIIIDDGSRDDTPAVISRYIDPRIKVIRQAIAGGASAARNAGMRMAAGTYIAFLDDDDEYLPDFLHHAHIMLREHALDFLWCGVQDVIESAAGQRTREIIWPLSVHAGGTDASLWFATKFATSIGFVIRRECRDTVGDFDETMPVSEDLDYLFRLLAQDYTYSAIPMILVRRYMHIYPSLSRSTSKEVMNPVTDRMLCKHQDLLDRYPYVRLHYMDMMAGDYYRIGKPQRARQILSMMLRDAPFRGRTWEKIVRFEVLKPLKRKLTFRLAPGQ